MKIKDGFILREVAGNFIIVAIGEAAKAFNGVINLNETGAFMWRVLEKGCDKEGLKQAILNEYDVSEEIADRDAEKFITKLTEAGLIK